MKNNFKIGVIGGGSWATAIVKMLCENVDSVNWWMRNEEAIDHINSYGHNPNYISDAELKKSKLNLSSDINEVVKNSDYLVLAVPSAFLKSTLQSLEIPLKDKIIISAIKGIVPENNTIVGEFIHNQYDVPYENIGVITGPCHAEEVALERLSYLTIACCDVKKAKFFANAISGRYIKTTVSDDIYGTEYASVLKNVIALASGICHGLGYGDNFQAVLVSNAIREIKRFVDQAHPIDRDIKESAYLGDLLVTAYSQFSRNRTFGEMIGGGYSVNSAQLQLKMIAEGYYAVKCIMEINEKLKVEMPITQAVYNILYDKKSAKKQIKLLTDKLN
ncbi:MAG: NAD(P)H-dependent glycerol-3-phosphate dehydrogenase [Flavobacteriales bacterium]|nr:NAD(P)H-dependent glycerol-3-phosphate dehydrogenase [Flavobacteriales bacterium]MBT6013848.1 NAD(P)H-dependent glycerol-3-phosphate dehydrogenase [Flavobacteriales bacterium]MBT7480872.1 NAD(P)H-dependent glycerol-3-phosphate dehydrogenase [Flavobacteriales bacterium]